MTGLRQLFIKHVAQTSPSPVGLEITKGNGVYLYDSEGKKYMDLISGIAVSNLGHQFQPVIQAIRNQLDQYMHLMVYGEYIQSPQVKLAERLTSLLPSTLDCVFFTNSGTEATEGALKLAKRFSGRSEIICFRNAYHGSTQGALSVCGNETLKNSFRPLLPDVHVLDFNSIAALQAISKRTACVIAEPIQGEAGINLPNQGYLAALRDQCSKTNTLLIFDEIQSGMGRTGKLFSFEHDGVVPDILLLGKAFGGGMPLGAFISAQEIMNVFTSEPMLGNLSTFGGHPVCCAAALASLNELCNQKFLAQVTESGAAFVSQLKHPKLKAVRGIGLFLALEFENEKTVQQVVSLCLKQGLITDWFLFAPHCLRIAPPLNISKEEIRWACNTILESLNLLP